MVYEIKDDLLALAVGNPEDMPGLYVDDVCGVAVTIMEFELVNAKALGLPLWFDERCAIDGVFILQTLKPFSFLFSHFNAIFLLTIFWAKENGLILIKKVIKMITFLI